MEESSGRKPRQDVLANVGLQRWWVSIRILSLSASADCCHEQNSAMLDGIVLAGLIDDGAAGARLVLSVGASLLWFWLLSRGAASRVSAFHVLTPVFGLFFGAALLGGGVQPGDVLGLLAVALGSVLMQRA